MRLGSIFLAMHKSKIVCSVGITFSFLRVYDSVWAFMFRLDRLEGSNHRALIPSPLPRRVAKTGRNHLNEEFTPLLPNGIGESF